MGPCPWTCFHPFDQILYTDPLHSQIPNSCPSQSLIPLDIMPKLNPNLLKAAVVFWIMGRKNISSTLKLGNLFSMLLVLWVRGHRGAQKKHQQQNPKTCSRCRPNTKSRPKCVQCRRNLWRIQLSKILTPMSTSKFFFSRYVTQANVEWHYEWKKAHN